jgi:hypothetical protein
MWRFQIDDIQSLILRLLNLCAGYGQLREGK